MRGPGFLATKGHPQDLLRRQGRKTLQREQSEEITGTTTYRVSGQIVFASAESFVQAFDFANVARKVVIDLNAAHLWDITAVGALDKMVIKFRRLGVEVEVLGFNEASADMVDRFALHDKDER